MEKMVVKATESSDKRNRHGNPLTIEQVVKLETARRGLHRKLIKSGRFRSIYGDDADLDRYLTESSSDRTGNGYDNVGVNKHKHQNGDAQNHMQTRKAAHLRTVDARNNNFVENDFTEFGLKRSSFSHPRTVAVERTSNGEFDLTLKEVTIIQSGTGNALKQEQSVILIGSGSTSSPALFLPGDRILEVNDGSVEGLSRSDVWGLINRSGNKVKFKVEHIPELNKRMVSNGEIVSIHDQLGSLKRTGSRQYHLEMKRLKDADDVDGYASGTMVWLVHNGGFSLAEVVGQSSNDPTKIIIRLQHSDVECTVDQNEIEEANPPSCDRLEDLSQLPYLNESSFVNTLRQRFAANLTHTYVGQTLVAINPMRSLSIYSDKIIGVFEGCRVEDMPPHIYATAQSAYRNLVEMGQHQSLVLTGHSGSGKTTSLKQILYYYTTVATKSPDKAITINKLNAMFVLLEAFGNCRTIQNSSATRFLQMTSVNFDRGGIMAGISIQALLLERTRILRRPEGEPTFHVFYRMLNGLDNSLRRELFLENLTDANLFLTPLKTPDSQQKVDLPWNKIHQAMCSLEFTTNEIKAVCSVVAAIYHLGVAGSMKGTGGKQNRFARPSAARRAAKVLGTTLGEISDLIFGQKHLLSRSESVTHIDLIENFVFCLYSELFQAITSLINRSLASKRQGSYSITLLDSAGFQNPASCGRLTGSSFQDLCSNYFHERLQMLFKETMVTARVELYRKENIECDLTNVSSVSTSPTIGLIDGKSAGGRSGLNPKLSNTFSSTPVGLLPLLDETGTKSTATDETFRQTFLNLSKSLSDQDDEVVASGEDQHQLLLNHICGSCPILYDVQGWIKLSRGLDPFAQAIHKSFLQSDRREIRNLLSIIDSSPEPESGSSCRKVITTIDRVVDKLKKSSLRFILCVAPLHSAGLCDATTLIASKTTQSQKSPPSADEDFVFNESFVRLQLYGYDLMNVARLYRQGFPENMSLEDFRRRYGILVPTELRLTTDNVREAVQQILDYMNVDKNSYQLGRTQVFLQPEALLFLNEERKDKLTSWAEKLQTICRGWLGRRKLEKLQRQTACIQCIQNNVRIMASVKDWLWWKLFSKVRPLVQANILEREKKLKSAEMEELKKKLEKIEKEKNELKEAVSLMGTSKARRGNYDEDEGSDDVMDGSSTYLRSSSRVFSNLSNSEEEEDETYNQFYREKYENARRQGDMDKKKIQRLHEDTVEDLLSSKTLVEKKLNHALEDIEEQQSLLDTANKRSQQYSRDISSLKNNLNEERSQGEELKEKQRILDAEVKKLTDLLKTERNNKEKLQRERDKMEKENREAEMKLKNIVNELELESDKNKRLQQELEFMSTTKKDDKELTLLRKLKIDLEKKCQRQEEAITNQEAVMQQLELDKTHLESIQEKLKQQQAKMQRNNDEELEEQRKLMQKKIQGLVSQLEEETTEKEILLREKVEVDKKLQLMAEPDRNKEITLRRKIKRMKVLLHDYRFGSNPANNKALKQIKLELEDALRAASAATKAKKLLELEIAEIQVQADIMQRSKEEADERYRKATAEQTEISLKLDSAGDDYDDLLKKYKALVQQNSLELSRLQEQSQLIEELLSQLEKKKEENESLQSRLHYQQNTSVSKQIVSILEAKIHELESVAEMEKTERSKAEKNVARLKMQLESELNARRQMETEQGNILAANKKLERQIRDLNVQLREAETKESELDLRKGQLEKRLLNYETECDKYSEELQHSNKRITELQKVLESEEFYFDSDEQVDSDEDFGVMSRVTYNSLLLSPKRSLEEQSEA